MNKLSPDEQCPDCGRFANRGVSIDAVIVRDKEVLLVKRGIEPYEGYWALPGGYVEWDESTEETVKREVNEETGLHVTEVKLVGVYSSPDRHPKQVINVLYIARVADGDPKASDDAEEVAWFSVHALPENMAFDHRQEITDALGLLATHG